MARIVCVGSMNHDITVRVRRRPLPDETLHGESVAEYRGGKGANQIVAAARLGAETAMVACVGEDSRGDFLVEGLVEDGVDTTHVHRVGEPTGVAVITVDPDDVSIIIVAGANGQMDAARATAAESLIADADALLLQGEVPADAAIAAAEIARANGTRVVLNPAPFNDVAQQIVPLADVIIVNRQEAHELGDVPDAIVVTTLGASGSDVTADGLTSHIGPFDADVIDPTGAGDCFVAAFAVALAEGSSPDDAARFANAAGSLATEIEGAQPSLPTRERVDELLSR